MIIKVPTYPGMNDSTTSETIEEREWFLTHEEWERYLYTFGSHHRLQGLHRLYDEYADDIGTSRMDLYILQTFQHAELISENSESWNKFFSYVGDRVLRDSEGPIPVTDKTEQFRGYRAKPNDKITGYSWTLDKDKALWFARRFRCGDGENRYLATTTVDPQKIKGYLTERDEAEIILMPKDARPNLKRVKVISET